MAAGGRLDALFHVCCGPCMTVPLLCSNIKGTVTLPLPAIDASGNALLPQLYEPVDGTVTLPLPAIDASGNALLLQFIGSVDGNATPPQLHDVRVTGLFYNPNIHPADEFARRLDGARRLFELAGRPLIIRDDCMQGVWENFESQGAGGESARYANARCESAKSESAKSESAKSESARSESAKCESARCESARCAMCYETRLAYTAAYAKESGFGAFSTSLLISPYQNHDLIKFLCVEQSKKHNIAFLYADFRPLFREGQRLARELGLYRQKYCGCIISKRTVK